MNLSLPQTTKTARGGARELPMPQPRVIVCWVQPPRHTHTKKHTQYGTVRYSTVRCGAVWCSAVQCGAVRYGAVRCSAVQCGAVQMYRGTAPQPSIDPHTHKTYRLAIGHTGSHTRIELDWMGKARCTAFCTWTSCLPGPLQLPKPCPKRLLLPFANPSLAPVHFGGVMHPPAPLRRTMKPAPTILCKTEQKSLTAP